MEPAAILHADMDAFYASVEIREDPALRGRPVVVGGTGRRGVVSAASYEARRFGVRSAMPSAVARRLCPQAVFLAPRMDLYAAVSHRILEVFRSFTPLVEPLSLDEAFLDVTGTRALFGPPEEVARRLKERVDKEVGLTVSVGVASCKFVAKVASDLRKPDGLVVVPPGQEAAFLAPLPVGVLWGAGPRTLERMEALGLRTVGQLQALARRDLEALLGTALGGRFHELCRGLDPRPVESEAEARSLSHERTFEHDLVDRKDCRRVLLELAEAVGARLRAEGLRGRVVRLKVRAPDFTTLQRQARLPAPTHDGREIHRRAVELFEGAWQQDRPVRLLGVGMAALADARTPLQAQLFAPRPREKTERLLRAVDAIRRRFGGDAIGRGPP